ncbi:MAG: ABC transporter ATP-binding protein [Candidatus Lernaella stagnicola]|nr:ABC transporter ATP-binding protein [Candidatus Lernaella stagnicola]
MAAPLRFRDFSFTYRRAASPALRNVDFELSAGAFVGLTGRTGAGKTTLARAAIGLVPYSLSGDVSGGVECFGELLARDNRHTAAQQVGLVFQDFEAQLFSTSVRGEVAFGLESRGVPPSAMPARIDTALQAVGLLQLADRDPGSLSGGEKQRLAIACVLAVEPDILVLDEPTTDLDPQGKQEIVALLRDLADEGRTVLLIEHEARLLELADRVVGLHEGVLDHDAPFAQWRRDAGLCLAHGIQPPDLTVLAEAMGWDDVPADVDAALAALRGFDAIPPEPARHAGEALFSFEDVSFEYEPGRPVVRHVDLEIRRGEAIAVLGANGAGKTTLVGLLNGLRRPTGGHVLFDGRDTTQMSIGELGAHVGFVFQNPDHQIFAPTVFEEVAFGLKTRGLAPADIAERVGNILESVGLSGHESCDPFVMTKGERQKLALAGVLVLEPEVIIMDEPTTGLDAVEQAAMNELLRRLNERGHTVVVITHTMQSALEVARRAIIVDEGGILADGPVHDLFADRDMLRRARLSLPPATELSLRLGWGALSAASLARRLREAKP